ncbi:MAG: aminopeptidase P family protein [Clostridia bacterium]|nr:aminopeptidase P family protein [Clostridia bacterium]
MNTRLERLGRFLPADDTAALITAKHHIDYLTGFPSGDSHLLVTREKSYFLTDFRYIELAKQRVTGAECRMVSRIGEAICEIAQHHGLQRILLEASRTTLSAAERWRMQVADITFDGSGELDGWLSDMRAIKDEYEVSKILQAQALAEEGFEYILEHIREGMTEREIALELEFFIRKRGAQRAAFQFIVVSGANSSLPHGIPTDKPVQRGDFLTMDFGAVVDGYHSDMTRTVAVGAVSDEQRHVYETVLNAQLATLGVLQDGLPCVEADAAARRVIENAGYGECFGHATGHGVGMQVHEEPRLSAAAGDARLKAGNVVTVEPGIYLEGRFGVRIEDMALIERGGCRNLTKSPKELLLIK